MQSSHRDFIDICLCSFILFIPFTHSPDTYTQTHTYTNQTKPSFASPNLPGEGKSLCMMQTSDQLTTANRRHKHQSMHSEEMRPVYFLLDDVMILAFERNPDDECAVRIQCLENTHTEIQTDKRTNTLTHRHIQRDRHINAQTCTDS